MRLTTAPGHATELTREALTEGARLIVAVGGDGTISEVANGFFDGERAIAPEAELAVVCRGSGCDFIRTFGISKKTDRALDVAAGGTARTIDVGVARFTGPDGEPAERLFVNVASAGMTGFAAEKANQSSKRLGATVTFAWAGLSSLISYTNRRMRVSIDGEERELVSNNVIVANCRSWAGGMKILPMAEPDDGELDVLVWGDISKTDLVQDAAQALPRAPTSTTPRPASAAPARSQSHPNSHCRSSWTANCPASRRSPSRSASRRCGCAYPPELRWSRCASAAGSAGRRLGLGLGGPWTASGGLGLLLGQIGQGGLDPVDRLLQPRDVITGGQRQSAGGLLGLAAHMRWRDRG